MLPNMPFQFEPCGEGEWNKANEIPLKSWLAPAQTQEEKSQLATLGNCIVPQMAALAISNLHKLLDLYQRAWYAGVYVIRDLVPFDFDEGQVQRLAWKAMSLRGVTSVFASTNSWLLQNNTS